ncbi:MMPL family transporter [Christensenellaceae bacterium OttesenSCG-928-K19]|nr:MMPL family transporter [Christensenellaceae bacterium OttesenSCG-928-K19]
MERFVRTVLKHKLPVVIGFIVLGVIGIIASTGVKVNYDMSTYLPEYAASTVAMDKMADSYDTEVPNLRVMAPAATLPEVSEYKEKLQAVDGIKSINWLGDAVDMTQPLEVQDSQTVESWYKDGNALFSMVITEESEEAALEEIRNIIGERGAMSGSPVDTVDARNNISSELGRVMMIVIPVVIVLLMIATTSWIDPVLMFINIAIAIAINMGTNLIIGEVSFITQTTAMVLQLACSIDYSIFLLDCFTEQRRKYDTPLDAMVKAVKLSATSISSSGLTTIIGFLALTIMQFRIGADMGIVLAKGIAFSIITTLVFMPCLILCSYKLIDKTTHRSLMPSFKKLGKWTDKLKIPVIAIVAVLIVPCFLAGQSIGFTYGMSKMSAPQSQIAQDKNSINSEFGEAATFALLVPGPGEAGGSTALENDMVQEIKSITEVSTVISYTEAVGQVIPHEIVPDSAIGNLYSGGYSRVIITAQVPPESAKTFALVESLRDTAQKYYPDSYHLAGEAAVVYDMKKTITSDSLLVNLVSIGGIALVLLFTFRSFSLPFILLLTIEAAIFINVSVPYFAGEEINYIGYLIISSVQLGATVDYAILYANTYLRKRRSYPKKEAVQRASSEAAGSILTSGIILTVSGLVLGQFSTNMLISQLGLLLARGAALSTALVLLLLPGLLTLLDRGIEKTTWNARFFRDRQPRHRKAKTDSTWGVKGAE